MHISTITFTSLKSDKAGSAEKTTLVNILAYGASTQKYCYGNNASNLATEGLTEANIITWGGSACTVDTPAYDGPIKAFLTLNEKIDFNFVIQKSELTSADGFAAEIIWTHCNGSTETLRPTASEYGNYWRFRINGLNPTQMTEALTITIKDGDKEYTHTDSIEGYALRRLKSNGAGDAEKATLVDMLCYGASTQEYCGYNTDKLANRQLTAEDMSRSAWNHR